MPSTTLCRISEKRWADSSHYPTPTINPITIEVLGDPKGQPRPKAFARKFGNGVVMARVYTPGTAEAWKGQIALAAKEHLPAQPLEGPLSVSIEFRFARPKSHLRSNGDLKPNAPVYHISKPDRDNCEKATTDCLKSLGMFRDDSQICAGEVTKRYAYADKRPGATIEIVGLCLGKK